MHHLQPPIVGRLIPAYLADLQTTVIDDRMEERKFLEFLERLLAIVTEKKSAQVLSDLRFDTGSLFSGLGDKRLSKLSSFLAKRLPRKLRSSSKR